MVAPAAKRAQKSPLLNMVFPYLVVECPGKESNLSCDHQGGGAQLLGGYCILSTA